MSDSKPVRPPQVSLAGWLVVGGSVLVVLMAFSSVGDVRSLQTRESIEDYLSSPPGESLGLSVTGVQTLMRVALMVAAATAAATAILGWHALQRSRRSRVALTVLAVPLFVSGIASGGFASAVVTAAIVMLWFQPARDWFDGKSRPTPERPPPERPAPFAATPPSATPPATRAPGERDPLLDLPPPTRPPLHPTPYAAAQAPAPASPTAGRPAARTGDRPPAVTWACILTWLFASPAALLFAATLALVATDPDALVDEMHKQNPDLADQLSDATTQASLYVVSGGIVVWSLVAVVLAVLVWRRVPWAAVALMVSAGAAGAFCLVTVLASFVLVVPMAACAAALAMLLRPESRAWLRR